MALAARCRWTAPPLLVPARAPIQRPPAAAGAAATQGGLTAVGRWPDQAPCPAAEPTSGRVCIRRRSMGSAARPRAAPLSCWRLPPRWAAGLRLAPRRDPAMPWSWRSRAAAARQWARRTGPAIAERSLHAPGGGLHYPHDACRLHYPHDACSCCGLTGQCRLCPLHALSRGREAQLQHPRKGKCMGLPQKCPRAMHGRCCHGSAAAAARHVLVGVVVCPHLQVGQPRHARCP
jgi:hypothetical protein